MVLQCGDRVVVKVVSPVDGSESELSGRIVDIFGDSVLALLQEPGRPAARRSFKKGQLRPGGKNVWKITIAASAGPASAGGPGQAIPG